MWYSHVLCVWCIKHLPRHHHLQNAWRHNVQETTSVRISGTNLSEQQIVLEELLSQVHTRLKHSFSFNTLYNPLRTRLKHSFNALRTRLALHTRSSALETLFKTHAYALHTIHPAEP